MKKVKLFLLIFFLNLYADVTIIGVGDVMLGTNYPSAAYLPPNDGKELLKDVNHILKDADITFGNLEGAILNQGPTVKKNCNKCYSFRMPEKLAENLKNAGFDVMSIANNHAADFGIRGLKNTQKVLKSLGIESAGLSTKPSVIFTKNGVKYGFAAFAPNRGTANIRDIKKAKEIVKELEEKSDIVIVSFHGGAEGANHQHITKKTEYFYGENRGNVYEFAHAVIDAGADVVFGHGPHVTRAIEVYKKRFIAYSLGNFCTYGRFSLQGVSGVAPIIKVKITDDGEFISAKIIPIKQIGRGIVRIDGEKRAIKIIQQLTKTDFPELKLKIEDNGFINNEEIIW